MSYQQVEETLTRYLSELLHVSEVIAENQDQDAKNKLSEDAKLLDSTLKVTQKVTQKKHKKPPTIETKSNNLKTKTEKQGDDVSPQNNTLDKEELSSNKKSIVDQQPQLLSKQELNQEKIQEATKEKTIKEKTHADASISKRALSDSTFNDNMSKSDLLPDKIQNIPLPQNNPLVNDKQLVSSQTPLALSKSTKPDEAQLSLTTEKAQSSTAYEQHKQRLEKMLEQVGAISTEPVSASAEATALSDKTALSAKTALSKKTKAPSNKSSSTLDPADFGIVIDANNEQIETVYEELPTLSSEWFENGRPNWAQDRFDILLIEVNGLKLALPLVALGQIQELDAGLTPLFGQAEWLMGLQKSPSGNVKTVNTAKFVMPERYQDEHNYKYVVSINGLQWGLAVDAIHQPISIDPDTIRWRTKRDNRPWMAGMVKDHMCVLLDIPSMGEILQGHDKNHRDKTGV